MPDSHRSKILVAEDDRLTAKLLVTRLEHEGHRVFVAITGSDAIAQAVSLKPDLILLDVGLPDLTGYEVCLRLRAHRDLAEVPLIMLTALDDRDSRLRGLEVGADDFLTKPYDEVELLARVRTIVRLNRYRRVQEAQQFREEMQLAADIQQRLLPGELPTIPGVHLLGRCWPATFVGGDYYDFVSHDGALYFLIGDVSGHGMASALFMSNARSAVRALLPWIPDLVPLAQALNTRMTEDVGDSGMFLSLVIGRLDPERRRVDLVNCGHPPPLLLRRQQPAVYIDATSPPIGMLDQLDATEASLQLAPDDLLVLYTDGLLEARAPEAGMFGIDRFEQAAMSLSDRPLSAIADGLLDEIRTFTMRTRQEDDLTLLLLRQD